jgi:hypothetical protein
MKFFASATFAALTLTLTGCATTAPHAPSADQISAHEAHASALAKCAESIKDVVTGAGDATAKVVAVGALERMCGAGQAQMIVAAQTRIEAPRSIGEVVFGAALQMADVALRAYGIRTQRDVAITQANTQAATTQASYAAFSALGNTVGATATNIATAGFNAANRPALPTTQINVTGAGNNIGSGTLNSNSGNTARTCTGGNGGAAGTGSAGGGSATLPGGVGGAARC